MGMLPTPPPPGPGGPVPFGTHPDGGQRWLVRIGRPDGIVAAVTDHGATLVELWVPDRAGRHADVTLGFDRVDGYVSPANAYLGASVGRVANRIADARFTLAGRSYRLAANEGTTHLHGGGELAFSQVRWELVDHTADRVVLRHVSPDGAEGYPGEVTVTAAYRTDHDRLTITYEATTDAPTPLDLTNHAYLNLRGHGDGDVLDHELTVAAGRVLDVDAALLPTGQLTPVDGTPLDLRSPVPLRGPVSALARTPALGIDHHLVLEGDGLRPVAWLRDPTSGRELELTTDQPGLQVYTGNRLDPPVTGKGGRRYLRHGGLCLEAHHHPGALAHPGLPSIVLTPDRTYRHTTVLRFAAG